MRSEEDTRTDYGNDLDRLVAGLPLPIIFRLGPRTSESWQR